MSTSIFLARLMGPIMLAVGIGMLVNGATYRKLAEDALRSPVLIYLSGLLTMTAGMAVVLAHSVWAPDWRVVITILGWLAVFGRATRIICPHATEKLGRWVLQRPSGLMIGAIIWLALGALFTFFGYRGPIQ